MCAAKYPSNEADSNLMQNIRDSVLILSSGLYKKCSFINSPSPIRDLVISCQLIQNGTNIWK